MRQFVTRLEFVRAVEGQLSAGEQLVTWCECCEIEWLWGTRMVDTGGWIGGFNYEETGFWYAGSLSWLFISLTNINLRLGTWRAESLGYFKGNQAVPEVASVQTFAIKDIASYEFASGAPSGAIRDLLKAYFGDWPKSGPAADITDMNLSLTSGQILQVSSPYTEFLELHKNLDAAKSKASVEMSDQTPEKAAQLSVADELGKLADLRDRGILSDEEFEQQKASLLKSD